MVVTDPDIVCVWLGGGGWVGEQATSCRGKEYVSIMSRRTPCLYVGAANRCLCVCSATRL